MRHVDGESRSQGNLLPDTLDDYVAEDHPVRVIDAFIDNLDVVDLGFSKATTKATGRKPYNPADLLKLYVYGYPAAWWLSTAVSSKPQPVKTVH